MTSILAPAVPEPPAPWSFPLVATVAPVVMGLAMWAVTQSPLSLLFAGLGPLIAIGSLVDSRIQSRRRARTEGARFAAELDTALVELDAAHSVERATLESRFPEAAAIEAASWSGSTEVRLGTADIASAVRLDGLVPRAHQLDDLVARSRTLAAAPAIVDVGLGVAIVGTGPGAAALARSVLVQLASRLAPEEWRVAAEGEEPWLGELPQRCTPGEGVTFSRQGAAVRVCRVATARAAPSSIGVVVDGNRVLLADGTTMWLRSLERLSMAQAAGVARRLAAQARVEGRSATSALLPATVRFSSLAQRADGVAGHELNATIGVDATGPTIIDLVAAGPHAVIGGTTGSGKSELLISWALAMAATHSPARLNLLLVDFKGGASFTELRTLPHCVGVLTDLDAAAAERALESLAAEIRFRERRLAETGARSIEGLGENGTGDNDTGLARLVIIVDEFAAVATEFPELHVLFADLAARGRSLGLHLILCTQRPAGVVRDAVFANVGLRISLRVHNAADSIAVIGSGAAAELPVSARGRAILSANGEPAREVQLALAASSDIAAIGAAWPGDHFLRRPWCEPLPSSLPLGSLAAHVCDDVPCLLLGLSDLPAEQAQPPAVWHPRVDGHLLVVGSARSGASTLLATFAASGGVQLARDPDTAWDAIARYAARVREGVATNEVVLLDDLDSIVDTLGADHGAEFIDNLTTILRAGAEVGLYVALATRRLGGQLHGVLALCSARLLLRQADRQEHVLAGAVTRFDPRLPPGAGEWRGARVQVAQTPVPRAPLPASPPIFELPPVFAVVSSRPAAFGARLGEQCRVIAPAVTLPDTAGALSISTGDRPTAMIGDVAGWQEHWGAIARLRSSMPVVFDGCSVADFRTLTQLRTLPPPISRGDGTVWLLTPDGKVRRARLDPRHPSE